MLTFPLKHMISPALSHLPSWPPTPSPQLLPPPRCYSSTFFPRCPPLLGRPFLFKSISKSLGVRVCFCCGTDSSTEENDELKVELGRLLALLPEGMRRRVREHPEFHHLIEVVMDLGRRPLARFPSGDFFLSDHPIMFHDLQHATSQVGDFAIDNRAGISRTLHRISAIRNRKGSIIGLTCRVGRAISGSANLLQDLVKDGASLLLIGPPGVGKTTIIREIARMLADDYKRRVMIVDTSNEIGGDGDIPHAGIGNARRMQVPNSDMQHKVLIEAVENHMPQVIVIDEIGTKLEAIAASTIAQRGIQLVATAHGVTIENLIVNPSLEMLVGGVQSVTLGDEEASRRGVQKTVLERKGPSTFTCGVEIMSKSELRVHRSLEATVDAILSGWSPNFEVRKINSKELEHGTLTVQKEQLIDVSSLEHNEVMINDIPEMNEEKSSNNEFTNEFPANMDESSYNDDLPRHLYVYGEARLAIEQVVIPKGEPVELLARSSHIMSLQMDLIQKYQLQLEKVGKEPDVRLRILPFQIKMDESMHVHDKIETEDEDGDCSSRVGEMNGSFYSVDRLPLLPD
ncbi:protein SEEDLING PLASTID DEVELOPMENT 1-like isoform X2 [Telopea speciosissima]|uniref:protein SEEDLING PLASTID DEVELOPMENT 1-like isoform X2 n=1 Tax=Telopea speciosissima TaxID=54955 RepID=UPI001CC35C51|nr:protein SEEDLING PLASTID DEVELOPMENT 1-like isoform X2 [Telopea speciosissima]